MGVVNWKDVEPIKIKEFPHKGKMLEVKGISVRWLSKHGEDKSGQPEYGLRHFTAEPNGEIPIHSHFFHQTVYILTGRFECYRFDPETDEVAEKWTCGPGDSVYAPSLEPHGMKNMSPTEPATFLCCVCSVYEGSL